MSAPQPKGARPIRALVVDDEALSRRNVLALLRDQLDIEVIGECASGEQAVAEIKRSKPDLVFLDVQMPECDGFDVLELLSTTIPSAIVFVTAHDAHALRAFEFGALDYLLKPLDAERFHCALERARTRIAEVESCASIPRGRFIVRSHGRIRFVAVADIDWIEAADYYAQLHVARETHLLRKSLSELERELESAAFCRIHRSIIVNLARVGGLELRADGEYDALLKAGERLRVSRTFRRTLQERLGAMPSGCEG